MEDFRLDIMIDQGPNARSVRLSIPRFTLIGATTRSGLLTAPLRSRFTCRPASTTTTSRRSRGSSAEAAGCSTWPSTMAAARRSPPGQGHAARRKQSYPLREGLRQERSGGKITQPVAAAALELLEIDAAGLDEMDKRMLRVMAENYRGGPVGLSTVAIAVGEEAETLEEVHEPFLIQEGYLQRTPQGRTLTAKGYLAVGLKPSTGDQAVCSNRPTS